MAIKTEFLMPLSLYFSSSAFTTCVEDRQQWNVTQNCSDTLYCKHLLNLVTFFFFVSIQVLELLLRVRKQECGAVELSLN